MSHLLGVGIATITGLYASRVALRVLQRMNNTGANYAKGDAKEFLNHVGGFDEQVTPHEARLILGVSETATQEEIKKTHRALMLRNHTDRGGSPFIASKINEARDILSPRR